MHSLLYSGHVQLYCGLSIGLGLGLGSSVVPRLASVTGSTVRGCRRWRGARAFQAIAALAWPSSGAARRQLGQRFVLEHVRWPGQVPLCELAPEAGDVHVLLAAAYHGWECARVATPRPSAPILRAGVPAATGAGRTAEAHARRHAGLQRGVALAALQAARLVVAAGTSRHTRAGRPRMSRTRTQNAAQGCSLATHMRITTRSFTL